MAGQHDLVGVPNRWTRSRRHKGSQRQSNIGANRDHRVLEGGKLIANFGDSGRGEPTPGGAQAISETSFWNRRMHMFQRRSGWPLPPVVREITDPDLRYFVVARLAMQGPLHGVMCLNPSTLLRLCRTIECNITHLLDGLSTGKLSYPAATGPREDVLATFLHAHPERAAKIERALGAAGKVELSTIWPELDLAICWQSNLVEPYLKLVREYLSGVSFRDYITQSSECIMAIPTRDGASGGLLAYTCHFFEFIPASEIDNTTPDTLLAGELEVGGVYEIVCTTSGGLYRYRMGDCVRVTGFRGQVPQIEFLYRRGKTSSITGEKLTEYQVMEAVRHASSVCGTGPGQFVCFPRSGRDPHYGVLMTWPGTGGETEATAARWVSRVDDMLKRVNTEYGDKRESGRLGPVVGLLTDHEGFERYRQQSAHANVSDEQIKIGGLDRRLDLEKALPILREVNADNEV
ncbi:MAG: GH3 auxin-responsive promoter family protein [Gemmatimonadales bacterium]